MENRSSYLSVVTVMQQIANYNKNEIHLMHLYKMMTILHLLLPVTGVITAILLLGERPSIEVYIGGVIILFGVGMILIGKEKQK